MNTTYYGSNGCLAQQQNCYAAGNKSTSNSICENADNSCVRTPSCEMQKCGTDGVWDAGVTAR